MSRCTKLLLTSAAAIRFTTSSGSLRIRLSSLMLTRLLLRIRCAKLGYEVSGILLGHHHKQTMFQAASTSHSSHCSIDDASARIWPQECGGAHPRQALDAQESLSRIARDAARRDNVYTAKHFCEWQVSS